MALLTFPTSPVNGQLYPTNPLPGQTQYQWNSTDQTWVIVGTSTGVTAGTYGDAYNVGQFTVDSSGRITFAQDVPIATLITPAGSNEEIQFNNNGVFGASANLTWDGTELYANNIETKFLGISDSRNATNGSFIFGTTGTGFGESYIYNFYANRPLNIRTTGTSPISFVNASSATGLMAKLTPGGSADFYYNGSKKLETTSTGVSVTGNVKATAGQLQVSNTAQPTFVTGFQAPASFTQSVVYRLPSGDGAAGNVLSTNGSGNLSWVPAGSSTAGGSDTEIQFNNSGVLDGSSSLTWDGTTLNATNVRSPSGVIYSGSSPTPIVSSSIGAAMFASGTFLSYGASTNSAFRVRYVSTSVDTVNITQSGDFYLRDTSGNIEFTVTGAGNVYAKGTLAVDSTISTNGQFHLNSSQFRIIGDFPGGGDVTLGNVSGAGGLVVRCGQSQSIDFTNENGTVTFASIDSTVATVPTLVASGLSYPAFDGVPGEVLTTDGSGNLGWQATAEVVAVPGSSAAGGSVGQIAFGTGFFYWHDGTQWLRVAGSTF